MEIEASALLITQAMSSQLHPVHTLEKNKLVSSLKFRTQGFGQNYKE
jgi:hypothetical protein